jgi:hypothetical protein
MLPVKRLLTLLMNEMSSFVGGIMSQLGIVLMNSWNELCHSLSYRPKQSIESLIEIHEQYLDSLKKNFCLWSNSNLKNKLGSLCSFILKLESLVDTSFSYHQGLCHIEKRTDSHSSYSKDEPLLSALQKNSPKMIQDLLIGIHGCARAFQSEFDEFILIFNKQNFTLDFHLSLLDFCDWNEYHRRRMGFDERKYQIKASY